MSVSIHASSREDATYAEAGYDFVIPFQSTRPRGRTRPAILSIKFCPDGFNPRVLAGGRDTWRPTNPRRLRFQSTRPRGRTRLALDSHLHRCRVSIHASSREDATKAIASSAESKSFNPRVLAGGRDEIFSSSESQCSFQSTRPRGRTRPFRIEVLVFKLSFNPRVLAGGRDADLRSQTGHCGSFNPRVLAGGRDCREPVPDRACRVSIHASSREDATEVQPNFPRRNMFQSTRPRGRTRLQEQVKLAQIKVSIHASSREDAT